MFSYETNIFNINKYIDMYLNEPYIYIYNDRVSSPAS